MVVNTASRPAFAAQRKRDLLRSFFLSTVDGIFAVPIGTISLPANLLLIALVTQAYPLPNSTIGLFMALPFIANFLLIFPMPAAVQRWSSKKLTAVSAGLHLLTWIALAIMLPWLPRDNPGSAGRWLIGWFFVSSTFAAVNGLAWNSWTQEWVPTRLRGKFFGRRNRFVQFSALAFLLVAGWVLTRGKNTLPAFQAIIAGVALMRLFSLRCMAINPTHARQLADDAKLPLLEKAGVLLSSRSFLSLWLSAASGPSRPIVWSLLPGVHVR